MPDTPKKLVRDLVAVMTFLEDPLAARPLTSRAAPRPPATRPRAALPLPGLSPCLRLPPLPLPCSPGGHTHTHTIKPTLAPGARTQPFSSQVCPSSYPLLRSHRSEEEAETQEMEAAADDNDDDDNDDDESTQEGGIGRGGRGQL